MLNPATDLRRTLCVHAAHRDLSFVFHDFAAANRTVFRHAEPFLVSAPQVRAHTNDGWNHFTRFLDQHDVADANVFTLDLFLIVQGRPADR